jgi:hypothetical protein
MGEVIVAWSWVVVLNWVVASSLESCDGQMKRTNQSSDAYRHGLYTRPDRTNSQTLINPQSFHSASCHIPVPSNATERSTRHTKTKGPAARRTVTNPFSKQLRASHFVSKQARGMSVSAETCLSTSIPLRFLLYPRK